MKRIVSMILCVLLALTVFSGFVLADEKPENGWYTVDGTNAQYSDGKSYPIMLYYKDGDEVLGWQLIDGSWYYFRNEWPLGEMYRDTTRGQYYLGYDGKMVTNYWREIKTYNSDTKKYESSNPRQWEYYGVEGKRTYGWSWINGKLYYFDANGLLQTGWYEQNGNKYYLTEYGAKVSKWVQDEESGDWTYFKMDGALAKDEWVQVKTKWYLFGEDNVMLTGLQEWRGKTYYLEDSGARYTGWKKTADGDWIYFKTDGAQAEDEWVQVKGKWYLFGEDGIMLTGLQKRYDYTYYFADSGAMVTGWKQLDGEWYYFRPVANANGPEGSRVNGWVISNGKWYYMSADDCAMVTGWRDIYSGSHGREFEYFFNSSGAMQTGWEYVDGDWYYFRLAADGNGPEGSKATGWIPAGDKWYYTDPEDNGAMVLGWKVIAGNTYYFDEGATYGQRLTGEQTIDGKKYVFDGNGILIK